MVKETTMVLMDQATIVASLGQSPKLSTALCTGLLRKLLDCETGSHFRHTHKNSSTKVSYSHSYTLYAQSTTHNRPCLCLEFFFCGTCLHRLHPKLTGGTQGLYTALLCVFLCMDTDCLVLPGSISSLSGMSTF